MKKHQVLFAVLLFTVCNYNLIAQQYVGTFNSIDEIVSLGDKDYFVADDGIHGKGLWKTDATPYGTSMVKDILEGSYGSDPENLFVFKNHIYFSANNGITGHELWKSDGTKEGTVLLKDIHPSHRIGSNPRNFTVYKGELYFTASNKYNNGPQKLYKTDGTSNGTKLVYADNSSSFANLTVANNLLYFSNGQILYQYDANTNNAKKIDIDEYYSVAELNSFNDNLYFITHTSYRGNIRLYRITGSGDVILLKEFKQNKYGNQDIHDFTNVGNLVFFSKTEDDGSSDYKNTLWKTDGSPEGTVIIKSYDWQRHIYGSRISNFIEYKGKLFFNGGRENEFALMQSDGTTEGTVAVTNENKVNINFDSRFVKANGLIYFASGRNVWYSNGSETNTKKISNLTLSRKSTGELYYLKSNGQDVYFRASLPNLPNNNYYNRSALYSTKPGANLTVSSKYTTFNNEQKLNLESKIDSVLKIQFQLTNNGNSILTFSKIEVIGKAFYLDGKNQQKNLENNPSGFFPRQLESGKSAYFNLYYYPAEKGHHKGMLKIFSSDTQTPEFKINLKAYANSSESNESSETMLLKREITFEQSNIQLSSNSFRENTPISSIIGKFNVNKTNDYEFSLIQGDGDYDNSAFKINDNNLILNKDFKAIYQNTISLRVAARNKSTDEIIENILVLRIIAASNEGNTTDKECSIEIENILYNLNDVVHLKNKEFVAVGTNQTILKTYDAGETWQKKHKGDFRNLHQVKFASDKIGYCVGERVLLKTQDGGETWFPLNYPEDDYPYPNKVAFINSEIGFLYGDEGKILKTVDGGKNWIKKELGNDDLYSVSFINQTTGYICSSNTNKILKTTDTGETWHSIDLNIDYSYGRKFADIYFLNEQNGYLLSRAGEVFITKDGGNSWIKTKKNIDGTSKKLYFNLDKTGYLLSNTGLYKTEDHGETWNNLFYSYKIDFTAFANSKDDNYSIIVDGDDYSFNNGIAIKSPNKEWKIRSNISPATGNYAVTAFEDNVGIYLSRNEAYRTKDNGLTWSEISLPNEHGIVTHAVIRKGVYYATGRYNFYKSIDHGETWIKLGALDYSRFFHFINDQTIIAIGKSESNGILRSVDGGESWNLTYEDFIIAYDLDFINEKEGVGVGLNGIIKTVDAGKTWRKINIPKGQTETSSFLYSVEFYENIGIAGAEQGILYKSIDKGNTWKRVFTTISDKTEFLYAKSKNEWYAVSGPILYKSSDAGETWNAVKNIGTSLDKFYKNGKNLYANSTDPEIFNISLDSKNTPNISNIDGDLEVVEGTKSTYSVLNENAINYKWSVSGNPEINFQQNYAEVLWKTPGTYTITVTPISSCSTGPQKSIEVKVLEKNDYDIKITGDTNVKEFSTNKTYRVSEKEGIRYQWFADGVANITQNKNTISVDWGPHGTGTIQIIETDIKTGIRHFAFLNINIEEIELGAAILEVTNATCIGKKNGKLKINTGDSSIPYTAVLTTGNERFVKDFVNDLTFKELKSGEYMLCLTAKVNNYSDCYTFKILEPEVFEVQTNASQSNINKTTINMKGGEKPYRVFLNGHQIANTHKENIAVNTTAGDYLEVVSSGDCSLSYGERISTNLKAIAYPNPTFNSTFINLEKTRFSENKLIQTNLYSSAGNLLFAGNIKIKNKILEFDFSEYATGIYFLKLGENNPETIKIIKR